MNGFIRPKLHDPIPFGKERVVAPDADKIARMITRPPLADNDAACGDFLTAVGLDAQTLGI